MAETALRSFGRIDILCPNAAIFDGAPIESMPEALWDRLLGVNLKGVFLCVQACLPPMKAQKYGRICVTSSITGPKTAIPGMAHYAASKGGINGFIRAAALELAKHGITINGVEPGHVLTPGAEGQYDPEFKKAVESFIPMGRLAQPEDIARAVLFLASDDCAYMTGQTFTVDGGVTLPEYPPPFPRGWCTPQPRKAGSGRPRMPTSIAKMPPTTGRRRTAPRSYRPSHPCRSRSMRR